MSKERAWTRQSLMAGAAVILVLVTGLVHLVETPANYAEAAYKGILFFLNGCLRYLSSQNVGVGIRAFRYGWGADILCRKSDGRFTGFRSGSSVV